MKSTATTKSLIAVLTVILLLFFDQWFKIYIKTNFTLGQEVNVIGTWFKLHFTENPGMAFGWTLGGSLGKIILTSFRLIASIGIIWYISKLIKDNAHGFLVFLVSLILAGAIGNIIDSIFYGQLFTESTYHTTAVFANGNGYAPYFMGKVVDMLYFPIIDTQWPSFLPIIGGTSFQFFRPVFNIADMAISIGIFTIIFFRKRLFTEI